MYHKREVYGGMGKDIGGVGFDLTETVSGGLPEEVTS